MTGRRGSLNRIGYRLLALLLSAVLLVLTGCSGSGAEEKVKSDLEMLKESEAAGSRLTAIQELLSSDAGEDFDEFLAKVREFDYEITGSELAEGEEDSRTVVSVRIKTFDFGREYLAAWTDYLAAHEGDAASGDMTEFYDGLFERLADAEEKDYIREVKITAIEPLDSGEWVTDISVNEELQDALFGGMVSEMRSLAAE